MSDFVFPFGPKLEPGIDCSGDVVLVQQSFARESDINYIVGQYVKTGVLPSLDPLKAVYQDCPTLTYHEALNLVVAAEEAFLTVPADVRAKFQNDPGRFVDFVIDPANHDQLVEMGLSEAPAAGRQPEVDAQVGDTPKA